MGQFGPDKCTPSQNGTGRYNVQGQGQVLDQGTVPSYQVLTAPPQRVPKDPSPAQGLVGRCQSHGPCLTCSQSQ